MMQRGSGLADSIVVEEFGKEIRRVKHKATMNCQDCSFDKRVKEVRATTAN